MLEQYNYGLLLKRVKGYRSAQAATWSYLYDPATVGPTSMTDPNGHVWQAAYDSHGNKLTSVDPRSRQTINTYDSLNDLPASKDPNGVTTTNSYDSNGDAHDGVPASVRARGRRTGAPVSPT